MIKTLSFMAMALITANFITFGVHKEKSAEIEEKRTRIIGGVPAYDKDYKSQISSDKVEENLVQ